jgi:hypothetical protein
VHFTSIHEFERCFHANIKSHNFQPGAYVLVCNSKVEYKLSKKTKLCYSGPMVVVRRMKGGSYMLAKLNGAISKLQFTTFRIIPYYLRCDECISVTEMMGVDDKSIDKLEVSKTIEPDEDNPEGALYISSPHFNPIAIYCIYSGSKSVSMFVDFHVITSL